jgi:serine/threonine-protein kinase
MANVWLARTVDGHGGDRLLAIKTILPRFVTNEQFQEMFLREGGIAARISHRNVARVFDLGEVHGVLFIAMEYVDGDALGKLNAACRKSGVTIPPAIVLRVMLEVCDGLHHAHELRDGMGRLLNIVHRDISPQNILVASNGIAKVIDFGIASAHLQASEDTEAGSLKGKARFMAPEQALGHAVDRRTDIWAVGAVLYQLLAGRPAYAGKDHIETLQIITSGAPPPPLPPELPPTVQSVVLKALAHSPADRYQTAEELQKAIDNAIRETNLYATHAEVAAFAAQHLADRAAERRRTIDVALASAAERARGAGSSGVLPISSSPSVTEAARKPMLSSPKLKYAALGMLLLSIGLVVCVLLTLYRSP